ncbi:hypothetical protein TNCV_4399441 [Trichonephila clavipes]|nr:hypothetical protein TNCV_4399441 [Trichonephila clavipes]
MLLAVALSTIQNSARFHLNFEREQPGGGQGPPTSLTLPLNHTRGLAAQQLFKVPSGHKGTIHLQTSLPSPGFALYPYGSAVMSLTT